MFKFESDQHRLCVRCKNINAENSTVKSLRTQPGNNFQATHNGENFNHNTRLVPWITPAQTKKKDHYTNRNNTSTIKI